MRQLFSWRFIAAVLALGALAVIVNAVIVDDQSLDAIVDPEPVPREIDLVAPIFSINRSDDFDLDAQGVTSGFLDIVLSEARIVRVTPGATGEISCDELDAVNKCALFVDLLGDAVIWFAILPQGDRATAEVPAIVDLEDDKAQLVNGWLLPYPPVIERECNDEDIPSFSDFLRRFGPGSITTVDLLTGQVVAARCADDAVPTPQPAPTTLPEATLEGPVQAPTSVAPPP